MDPVITLAGEKPRLPVHTRPALTRGAARFVEHCDTAFMATIAPDGGPYVQHRGGAPGFLHCLDAQTIAFADYAGNRQYVSVDNLAGDPRVMLILMDFAARRRMKIWGRARVEHSVDARLAPVLAAAQGQDVERVIIIDVDAWAMNCPQHITARYTADEWQALAS